MLGPDSVIGQPQLDQHSRESLWRCIRDLMLDIRFSAMQVFDALLCGFKRRVRALVFRRIEIGNGSPRGPFQVANPDYMACLAVNAQLWHRFWCLGGLILI